MMIDSELEWEDNRDEDLELSRLWLTSFGGSVIGNKKKKLVKKKIANKMKTRKRREAFPRKDGKYNEKLKDMRKESGNISSGVK